MLKPGIDLIHGVQHESNVLEGDTQALLIRACHNRCAVFTGANPRSCTSVAISANRSWYSLGGRGGALHAS